MTIYDPILVDAPEVLPVSLEECKAHLRVDPEDTDQDDMIELYLQAAVAHLDGETGWLGRAIVAQVWSQQFDAFAPCLRLGLAPVSSIMTVKYFDPDGVEQLVDEGDYQLINPGSAPDVRFTTDFVDPAVRFELPTVTVTFAAGYGDDTDVPAAIKAGILLMVADMFQQREAKVEGGLIENSTVARLLTPYRLGWVG